MAHPKGAPKTPGSGRKKGTANKLTVTFKQAVLMTFNNIGGVVHFTEWAKANPSEFYKIAARLIPAEIAGSRTKPLVVEHRTVRSEPISETARWINEVLGRTEDRKLLNQK
jgi:hypothetical protein